MGTLQEATGILRTAEQGLRDLIAAAAARGEYDDLPRLAEWAKHVSAILNDQPMPDRLPEPAQMQAPPAPANADTRANGNPAIPRGRRDSGSTQRSKLRPRVKGVAGRRTKTDYPKFFREGELLVKVGWSKGDRKTYEHKAPRRVVDALVQTLVQAGKGGQRFVMEGLLPLKDQTDNSDIPDYQSYLTLAWLRSAGLIVQHGRQGYSLPPDSDLPRETAQLWAALTTR
jgi:hypothetical protein